MGEFLLLLLFVAGVFWMFRKPRKKAYYGQTSEDAPRPSEPHRRDADDDTPKELTLGKRLGGIAFLGVWLIIWTAGCYMALVTAAGLSYGEEGYIFMRIWLAIAIPGWFFVAWTLFRLLRGDNVEFSFDGDVDGDGGGD